MTWLRVPRQFTLIAGVVATSVGATLVVVYAFSAAMPSWSVRVATPLLAIGVVLLADRSRVAELVTRRLRYRRSPAFRIVIGALFAGLAALIGLGWPESLPGWLQYPAMFLSVAVSVAVIELAKKDAFRPVATVAAAMPAAPAPVDVTVAVVRRAGDEGLIQQPEVEEPLPSKGAFRGRQRELDRLHVEHRRQRELRDRQLREGRVEGVGRPVLIFIHGKPGIGKTALAQEFARQLKDDYPDGQIYVNLGNAGDTLSASETLKTFLDALGFDEPVPQSREERAKTLRTLTADRRLLFILDAARTFGQVDDVMPSGSTCGAIVTSRRDISSSFGVQSFPLELMSSDDAIDMLYSVSKVPALEDVECVIEIVQHCGCLPIAIQCAGERILHDRSSICDVAEALRDEAQRLNYLTRQGIVIRNSFRREYDSLDGAQRRALLAIGQLSSGTFVPWVLCSMMTIELNEAEDICTRLNRSQLIDFVTRDAVTQLARYEIHPLIRLFVRELAREEGYEARAHHELGRLGAAYEGYIGDVVEHLDGPPVQAHLRPQRYPFDEEEVRRLIAAAPHEWARSEYANAVTTIQRCHQAGRHDLCWRIATRLGGIVPEGVASEEALRVFDDAAVSAGLCADVMAVDDVTLSRASTLAALERYVDMDAALSAVEGRLDGRQNGAPPTRAVETRRGDVALQRGEAFVQMRRPRDAESMLATAEPIYRGLDAHVTLRYITVLQHLNRDMNLEDPFDAIIVSGGDRERFAAFLERFEEYRRTGNWEAAQWQLDEAWRHSVGDARRRANLLYRKGKLHLEHWESLADETRDAAQAATMANLADRAVYRTTEAMLAFERMTNTVGQVRATALLARALVAAGRVGSAEAQVSFAEQEHKRLPASAGAAAVPLHARILWARGAVYRAQQHYDQAHTVLLEALNLFRELGDGRSRNRIEEMLSRANAPVPRDGGYDVRSAQDEDP